VATYAIRTLTRDVSPRVFGARNGDWRVVTRSTLRIHHERPMKMGTLAGKLELSGVTGETNRVHSLLVVLA
jgi:hypothetical protein